MKVIMTASDMGSSLFIFIRKIVCS
jgi:hypothetical protein